MIKVTELSNKVNLGIIHMCLYCITGVGTLERAQKAHFLEISIEIFYIAILIFPKNVLNMVLPIETN